MVKHLTNDEVLSFGRLLWGRTAVVWFYASVVVLQDMTAFFTSYTWYQKVQCVMTGIRICYLFFPAM